MARDTDRKKISEAIRLNRDWQLYGRGDNHVEYMRHIRIADDYQGFQILYIEYGKAGQVVAAKTYEVSAETGSWDNFDYFTHRRRERVLETIRSTRKAAV